MLTKQELQLINKIEKGINLFIKASEKSEKRNKTDNYIIIREQGERLGYRTVLCYLKNIKEGRE